MKINDASKRFEDNPSLGNFILSSKTFQYRRTLVKDEKLENSHHGSCLMRRTDGAMCECILDNPAGCLMLPMPNAMRFCGVKMHFQLVFQTRLKEKTMLSSLNPQVIMHINSDP